MYILKDNNLLLFFFLHIALVFMTFFISYRGSKGIDRVGVLIIALTYLLIVFTRQGLGVDESTYREAYRLYLIDTSSTEFEYSFNFLFYCLKILSISPDNFNNFICTLYVLFVSLLVLKVVDAPYKTLCILLFLFSSVSLDFIFNAYRQGIAFVFVFSSLLAYYQERKKIAMFFMVIAIGFHWSSIIIPLLLLIFRFIPKRTIKIILTGVIILTVIGFIIPLGILPTLKTIITSLIIKSQYLDKIIFYLTTSESSIYELNFFGRLPLLTNALLSLIICRIFYRYADFSFVQLITAVGLYCVVFMEMSFSFRNYYWLFPLFPFLIVNVLSNYKKNGRHKIGQILVVILFCHVLISFITYYSSPLIPLIFINT
ncbi:EpsG family protein [Escherichia albertii]|uniref:EpsG family protein n=1 Tax=Escherichia albertii TaxID=208962 RepID=UPI00211A8EC5|nr:EpsG family protein [Escherichia albertii]MCQ8931894.1 EpsG family protein [Escherichia albertii]MCQ8967190.1 EpsG family protein [Escherichia albertii]MCZ8934627.1 EpsG family protein [Escherichia albertii]UUK97465.1 EpsG family protein [Escherichia albertii]WCC57298.1 putative O-antigen polymerase [Escherichia albertii]